MTWKEIMKEPSQRVGLQAMIDHARQATKRTNVYPQESDWFLALQLTPYENVKMVLLGQDPYHRPHQAMGLAFSVRKGVSIPPSLKNIYKEIATDLGIQTPPHGDLTSWAQRGVLLLNTTLTVEEGKPLSHRLIGWEKFTDEVITALNKKEAPLVFLLWGAHARSKRSLINTGKHLVLEAPHPSPLSAHNGFFGCRHFSQTNAFLEKHHQAPINFYIDS